MQFLREFGRVLDDGEVRRSARERWIEWTPRILALGRQDTSIAVKKALEGQSEEAESDCKPF